MKLVSLILMIMSIFTSFTYGDTLPRDSEIIVLGDKGTLRGVVFYEDNGFVASSSELRPVADVTVSIIDERSGVILFQAITESSGHYFFKIPNAMLKDLSQYKLRVTNSEGKIIGLLHDLESEVNVKMGDLLTDLNPIFVRDQEFVDSVLRDSTSQK